MKEYTKLDWFLDFIFRNNLRKIEYFFAKRWLDSSFGKREYWGDVLSNWKSIVDRQDTVKDLIEFSKQPESDMVAIIKASYTRGFGDGRYNMKGELINQIENL
jgi:hypothetical protein